MKKQNPQYGIIRSTEELGRIVRAHRKNRRLTLQTGSRLGNERPRVLAKFKRGKETAEICKVLKALQTVGLELIIQPRRAKPLKQVSKRERGTDE